MKYNTKRTFEIYWQHVLRYKWSVAVATFFVVLAATAVVAIPYVYKLFFDILVADDGIEPLFRVLWYLFAVLVVHHLSWRVANYCTSYFQSRLMRDLADTCFRYLHKHSFNFFNQNFVGSLVTKTKRFYRGFEGLADVIHYDLMPLVVNVVLILFVLGARHLWLALVLLVWILVYTTINYIFTQYKLKFDVEKSKAETKTTAVLADTITNHANVKLFNGFDREVGRFSKVNTKFGDLMRFTWDLGTHFEMVQGFLMIALEVGLMYLAVRLWQDGVLTVGDFVLIQSYIAEIFYRLWNFGRIIRNFYERLADAEEMTIILNTPHEIQNAPQAQELVSTRGEIVFDDVLFYYHQTRPVLERFNLRIAPQEKIALVGPSGAGKTTIMRLLLRQHDVTSGSISIDGQRIDQVTMESLWGTISLVPQDPILFHRTLMDNIRYGRPAATDAQVVEAAKAAHCHEFIKEFPEGYETYVGERGVKLSGGERQRVAIARAILRNAPILVLDEATSSLDSESEQLIQDALGTLMKGRTVIVIAHRLSTIMKMDRILVIDHGEIVEEGSHTDLLKKPDGMYKRLWNLQAGHFV